MVWRQSAVVATLIALVVASRTAGGQDVRMGQYLLTSVPREILERPLPLREGIGTAHETVSTQSARAQAFYDQGLAYLHSYVWIEAARSFNEALRLDSNLAMAHIGLSYALGELGSSDAARQATARASALAESATGLERARIRVRASQLAANAEPDNRTRRREYEAALAEAVAAYPTSIELRLLNGQAMGAAHDGHGMAAGSSALPEYERALSLGPDYFATHHYLAHAYENAGQTEKALQHARRFAELAPAVAHAHHMHGHVLRRADRMKEAVEEFRRADEIEQAYFAADRIPPELDWHYQHNLGLLGTSFQYLGQRRAAGAALQRAFDLKPFELSEALNTKAWPLYLLASQRAAEALTASSALVERPQPILQALGHLLGSRAHLTLRRVDEAVQEGNAAVAAIRASGAIGGVLVPDLELAQGELLLRTQQTDKGRTLIRAAMSKLRAANGADIWIHALFAMESAGRAARETGDWVLAAEAATEMQQYDRFYAGTHYALALVAEQRRDVLGARTAYIEAVRRWDAADADLPELADARRRLAALGEESVR